MAGSYRAGSPDYKSTVSFSLEPGLTARRAITEDLRLTGEQQFDSKKPVKKKHEKVHRSVPQGIKMS